MNFLEKEIPWPEPRRLCAYVAQNPQRLWLDSALSDHPQGRYSYLSAAPLAQVLIREGEVGDLISENFQKSLSEPWKFLEAWLESFSSGEAAGFVGGLMGYLSYESYDNREKQSAKARLPGFPDGYFLLVDTILILDHLTQKARLLSWGIHSDLQSASRDVAKDKINKFLGELESQKSADFLPITVTDFHCSVSREEYLKKITQIKEAILAGDCYQVNYSQHIRVGGEWDPQNLYYKLRKSSPASHMAFLNGGSYFIYSASPETLFKSNALSISSFPIKGTRPRGSDPKEDEKFKRDLINSSKDRAELLMIVDLIRNDLGRFCRTGTVEVQREHYLETLSQVHHLVSEIRGVPKEGFSPLKILCALSPGGSITGAPKLKAMEWINRTENFPRGIYTGSLGYCSFNGEAQFNIAIRTAVGDRRELNLYAGGGIVVDSDPEAEYQESLDKLAGWFQVLNLAPDVLAGKGKYS